MSKVEFEVLIMDEKGSCTIQTISQLCHSFLSNANISSGGTLCDDNSEISIGRVKIKSSLIEPDTTTEQYKRAFLTKVLGEYDETEPLRKKIVKHVHNQGFSPIYILKDDVSQKISCEIYPLLYKVENALRAYLIKFMATRLGPKWWGITATGELSNKVKKRKNNEKIFSQYVDNKAYLIDYSDLGKMIYENSTGFTSKDDVIKKVEDCEETPEAIRGLKKELQSNYQKFFRKHFKKNDFQKYWEDFQSIRHKVAHNNLFVQQDLDEGKKIAANLISTINKASEDIPKIIIEEEEKEAIRSSFIQSYSIFDSVSEEKFISELREAQQYFNNIEDYVALSHFIKNHLGPQGYDYASSYDIADKLHAIGKVEIYEITPEHEDHSVKAIRTIE